MRALTHNPAAKQTPAAGATNEAIAAVELARPSGPAAAVILAAGLASFTLGLLSVLTAASASISNALTLSDRVGDVSGLNDVSHRHLLRLVGRARDRLASRGPATCSRHGGSRWPDRTWPPRHLPANLQCHCGLTPTGCGPLLHSAADVQGLRILWQEAIFRQQPEPFDGGHAPPVQPESPEGARPDRRRCQARVHLHPVPQGRKSAKSGLAARNLCVIRSV